MSSADGHGTSLRCHHCGREVGETVHTRTAYRVGYYSLHTGEVEPTVMLRGDDALPVTVLKLLRAFDFATCVDCYRRSEVRSEREMLFRPERAGSPDRHVGS